MLEYFKTILKKVSFDKRLFEKELLKAIKSLISPEIEALKRWCYERFSEVYKPVLDRCFSLSIP
jgi:hypothetical protein